MARQLEIFAPRFEAADAALVERISTVAPALVSVSGGTAALRLCRKLQERGLKTQLHLTSDLTPDAASSCDRLEDGRHRLTLRPWAAS